MNESYSSYNHFEPNADNPAAGFVGESDAVLRCSFCGLGEGEVARLFEGLAGYICDECVEVCVQLLADYRALGVKPPSLKQPWYKKLISGGGNGADGRNVCSFNHHDRDNPQGERLFPASDTQICEQCVRACEVLRSGLPTND